MRQPLGLSKRARRLPLAAVLMLLLLGSIAATAAQRQPKARPKAAPKPPVTMILSPEVVRQNNLLIIPIPLGASNAPASPVLRCAVTAGPPTAICAMAFSPNGKLLAVGGYQEVLLWDLEKATLLKRLGVGQLSGPVHALAFHKDGKRLVVGAGTPSVSGSVRIFDVETGQSIASFDEPKDVVYSLAISPDGKLLAAGSADARVYLWNLEDKTAVTAIKEHRACVLGVAFSPDGKYLATAGADRTLQLWEAGTWKSIAKVDQSETVHGVAFSPDGEMLAWSVGGPTEKTVQLRTIASLQNTPVAAPVKGAKKIVAPQNRTADLGGGSPLDIVWVAHGDRGSNIYVPCEDKTIRVLSGVGVPTATLGGHGDWVYAVAASPDGSRLASGSADGTVKLWSTADNRLLATLAQLSPRTDDWLIMTPQGYFAASSSSIVRWRTKNLATPPAKLTSLLESPKIVRELLGGSKSIGTPAFQYQATQP